MISDYILCLFFFVCFFDFFFCFFFFKQKTAYEISACLVGSVADLSVSVASRLIGEDLNDAEHRKIIERYVNEAGSFNAN